MAKRSFRWRGFGLEVEVPERAIRPVRRFVARRRPGATRDGARSLEFAPSIPPLKLLRTHDALERYMADLRATLEWYPEGWGGPAPSESEGLAEQVGRLRWYHTIELPGGVVTPGFYDHRPLVPHYGIPRDLGGKRVLDVGTWDGFWAFEFERRGAEVTAVDLDRLTQVDLPPLIRHAVLDAGLEQRFGGGFEIARRALGSNVRRVVKSVYDLEAKDLGTFDLVHMGDVGLHLERPLDAFRRLRAVTKGSAMIVDAFRPDLDRDSVGNLAEYRGGWSDVQWWIPSLNTLAQMVLDAGFSEVRVHHIYRVGSRDEPTAGLWRAILIARP